MEESIYYQSNILRTIQKEFIRFIDIEYKN